MPELPEVETVKRGLEKFIVRQKIQKIRVFSEKSFVSGGIQKTDLCDTILRIRRYGKALILDLGSDYSLMIHLRMTGQLIYDPKTSQVDLSERYAAGHPSDNFIDTLPNKQTRVIIELEEGTLYFNDQRKFGFIKAMPTNMVEEDAFIRKLGKEPWVMEPEEFYDKLQRHRQAPIKAVILNQSIVAGLGNIYADEALFMAKIHPTRKAGKLTFSEASLLLETSRLVMDRGIDAGGSTIRNYVRADGTKGDYLDLFVNVYHLNGHPCKKCGQIVEKIKVRGRGTHFCPNCQKQ